MDNFITEKIKETTITEDNKLKISFTDDSINALEFVCENKESAEEAYNQFVKMLEESSVINVDFADCRELLKKAVFYTEEFTNSELAIKSRAWIIDKITNPCKELLIWIDGKPSLKELSAALDGIDSETEDLGNIIVGCSGDGYDEDENVRISMWLPA